MNWIIGKNLILTFNNNTLTIKFRGPFIQEEVELIALK